MFGGGADPMPTKNEGVRRLQLLAAVIAFGGAGLGFLCVVLAAVTSRHFVIDEMFAAIVMPMLLGGSAWLLGWVVEGFLRPDETRSDSEDD